MLLFLFPFGSAKIGKAAVFETAFCVNDTKADLGMVLAELLRAS